MLVQDLRAQRQYRWSLSQVSHHVGAMACDLGHGRLLLLLVGILKQSFLRMRFLWSITTRAYHVWLVKIVGVIVLVINRLDILLIFHGNT